MQFDVLTLFPGLFSGYLQQSILHKAILRGLLSVQLHDIRNYTHDKHRRVDDRPYGRVCRGRSIATARPGASPVTESPRQTTNTTTRRGSRHRPAIGVAVRPLRRIRSACFRHPPTGRNLDRRLCAQRRRSRRHGNHRQRATAHPRSARRRTKLATGFIFTTTRAPGVRSIHAAPRVPWACRSGCPAHGRSRSHCSLETARQLSPDETTSRRFVTRPKKWYATITAIINRERHCHAQESIGSR